MKRFWLVLAMAVFLLSACEVSEGERMGTLTKFSYRGLVIKSWEGQLMLGETQDSVWEFSVEEDNRDLIELLKENIGKDLAIQYTENRYEWRNLFHETGYYVTRARVQ